MTSPTTCLRGRRRTERGAGGAVGGQAVPLPPNVQSAGNLRPDRQDSWCASPPTNERLLQLATKPLPNAIMKWQQFNDLKEWRVRVNRSPRWSRRDRTTTLYSVLSGVMPTTRTVKLYQRRACIRNTKRSKTTDSSWYKFAFENSPSVPYVG